MNTGIVLPPERKLGFGNTESLLIIASFSIGAAIGYPRGGLRGAVLGGVLGFAVVFGLLAGAVLVLTLVEKLRAARKP